MGGRFDLGGIAMNKQKNAPIPKGNREQKGTSRTKDEDELRQENMDKGATLEGRDSQARQDGSAGTGKQAKPGQSSKTDESCGCG
jgi:hypothetical protein